MVPNGSDQSLLNKLCTSLEKFPQFRKAKQSQRLGEQSVAINLFIEPGQPESEFRCQSVRHFTIKHYAGSVDYNIDSWVEKNRDVIENAVLEVMGESVKPLVKSLFPPGECYLSGPIRLALASCLCRNPVIPLANDLPAFELHYSTRL